MVFTGCGGGRHLQKGQKRLIQETIKAPKEIDESELKELYAQRPNRRFLGLPIYHLVAIYYWGEKRYDRDKYIRKKEEVEKKYDAKIANASSQKKINSYQFKRQKKVNKLTSFIDNGNQLMQWGERVAVFDSSLVEITINRFKTYLASEGYFKNSVTTRTTTILNTVTVTYRVSVEDPYVIDTILYRIPDSPVYALIQQSKDKSYIQRGDRYREENLTKERERLDLLMKDNGFYDFSRQYVTFFNDTTMFDDKRMAVLVQVRDPAQREFHKQFVVDSVNFVTDSGVRRPGFNRKTRKYRDVQYKYFDDVYSLKILSQRIFLAPERFYNRTNTLESQRQLNNLDAFKFVNINYDTSGGRFIANIFASPFERYEWSNEAGVNVTQGYPGPFYGLNFKKRNIFRGLENFDLNGRIGIEGAASAGATEIYQSTEAGINASLTFPQFILPMREAAQIRFGRLNPKTRVALGYTYTDRPEYLRRSANFSNTYTWQNQGTSQYSLALTNVSLINSTIKSAEFQERLNELEELGNFNLARSFLPSFVSSMIFGITWNRNYGSTDKNSVFVRGQFETGGTSLNFIDPSFISREGLQYFKYLRANIDFRRIKIMSKWATLAYRFNTGVAWSYGANRTLPYEKFFFAGGSRSIRAWSPRRLGLGSVPPDLAADPTEDGLYAYTFERPGDILIETSIELRSKLVGFIDGAIFIDAGNAWSFDQLAPLGQDGVLRGNSQFKFNSFLQEVAVGTGFGLRFDFTFLVMCFDVGIKMYDPTRERDKFVLDDARFLRPYATQVGENQFTRIKEPVVYNIGIGYPF